MRIAATSRTAATGRSAASARSAATGRTPANSLLFAPGLVGLWSPRQSVQYQLSSAATAVANGDPVGWAENLKLRQYPLIQATAGTRFTYRATGINGFPAWELDGGDWMAADGLAAFFTGTDQPFSFSAVVQVTLPTSNQSYMSLGRSSAAPPLHHFRNNTSARLDSSRRGDDNVSIQVLAPNDATGKVVAATAAVVGINFNGTQVAIWKNGVKILDLTAQNTGDATLDQFTIGALRTTAVNGNLTGFLGDIAIIKGYSDDADFAAIQAIMMSSYGITG
jgi:hypothetical protein